MTNLSEVYIIDDDAAVRRQQPREAMLLPLGGRERHPAVEKRVVQDGRDGRNVPGVLGHVLLLR